MHVLLTGLNHKTAPVEVRERVSFPKERLSDALPILANEAGEGVILSTCNRTEVYTVSDDPAGASEEVRRFLTKYHQVAPEWLAPHLYDRSDAEAVRHLFRVSSGLDSMLLGESEILGQVRSALAAASESHSLGAPASRLFHRAIRTGRRVREDTNIGRNSLSISYAAVDLAQRVLGNLRGLRVLLIGAGEAGRLVARALRTTGASPLMIANRTRERSDELARQLGGRSVSFSDVGASLADVDMVIVATEASDRVITREEIASAGGTRNGRPLFLFDLAVPRNIDPEVGAIDKVSLFNIDDLSSIAEENLEGRKEAAAEAERIVEEEVADFMKWWDSLEAVRLIKALRQRADGIRARELARALRKMPDLPHEDVQTLDAMTRSIINRLLHDPIVSLKQRASEGDLRVAQKLFRLWEETP